MTCQTSSPARWWLWWSEALLIADPQQRADVARLRRWFATEFLDALGKVAGYVPEIRRPHWREAVDACRLLTSPTYHLLRSWHGLPPLPYLGQQPAHIRDDPNLTYV